MDIPSRQLSEHGVEMHLATNFLGHFMFTNLILPKLLSAASAAASVRNSGVRVINVTSAGFILTPFRFSVYNWNGNISLPEAEQTKTVVAAQTDMSELRPNGGYVPLLAYSQSSTSNMLFMAHLADALKERGVYYTSLAQHPGSWRRSCRGICRRDFGTRIRSVRLLHRARYHFWLAGLIRI